MLEDLAIAISGEVKASSCTEPVCLQPSWPLVLGVDTRCSTAPTTLTGDRILWPYPHRWAPERSPEFRGDALPAVQAALGHYLQTRTKAVRSWEDKCSDTSRAMDVSFMVDDEQQLVFVKIDEAPEKRCPDGPPREFPEGDGGAIVILQRPMAPLVLDGISVYAVTYDGQILDKYRLERRSGCELSNFDHLAMGIDSGAGP